MAPPEENEQAKVEVIGSYLISKMYVLQVIFLLVNKKRVLLSFIKLKFSGFSLKNIKNP